jgi:hypothetical protein
MKKVPALAVLGGAAINAVYAEGHGFSHADEDSK